MKLSNNWWWEDSLSILPEDSPSLDQFGPVRTGLELVRNPLKMIWCFKSFQWSVCVFLGPHDVFLQLLRLLLVFKQWQLCRVLIFAHSPSHPSR